MKQLILTAAMIAISAPAYAQDDGGLAVSPEAYQERAGLQQAPTVAVVQDLVAEVSSTLASSGCAAALPIIEELADESNRLANIIAQGIEPFYQTRQSDREPMPPELISELADAEAYANALKDQRNEAWVTQGDCLIKTGNPDLAIAVLHQALRFIRFEDRALWSRARQLLWSTAGYEY
ncbi:hypothetical protein [Pelagibacterium sp. H642]|uniref:hypothetical protein n=1 Tax=Pelagibacterium sp. H642 TaxID=1881069 RepID=UPI00281659C9|nr:hypothetical protein [Pelagibacterium sp. H642]WMT90108.1 hypothetical protein NO934_15115 [Pelagibacterium sp. H642]